MTALTTAFSTIASDAEAAIAAVLPVALPILGIMIVVGLGIRAFKKASGGKG